MGDETMRNEQIQQQLDDLKNVIHHERRETRDSMNKLTEAITQLTLTTAESKQREEATNRRIDTLEIEVGKQAALTTTLDKQVATLNIEVQSNTKKSDKQADFYWRIGEKLITLGIVGGLLYQLAGSGGAGV